MSLPYCFLALFILLNSFFLPYGAGQSKNKIIENAVSTTHAKLQCIDKQTGKVQSMDIEVGEEKVFGHLRIQVTYCYKSPPEDVPESTGYVKIWGKYRGKLSKLFSGWMFASSPSTSTLTNHPRYNVWLKKCYNKVKILPHADE